VHFLWFWKESKNLRSCILGRIESRSPSVLAFYYSWVCIVLRKLKQLTSQLWTSIICVSGPGYHFLWLFFLFWCVILGFELRALCLLGRSFTTWACLQPCFCFNYFSHRVSHFCQSQPWTSILLPILPIPTPTV
jgi:hypothetical protein